MDSLQKLTKISNDLIKHKVVLRQNPPAPVAFKAASTSQTITLLGIPSKHVIVGVRTLLVTRFVAFGLSACSVTIGGTSLIDSGITTSNFYSPAFTLSTNPSSTTFMYWSPFAMYTTDAQDIKATFTSTGAQLSTLTAGEVEFTILYRSL